MKKKHSGVTFLQTKKGNQLISLLSNGFTVTEIVVVVSVLAVVGAIFVESFVRSLQGNSRLQIQAVIKQNGSNILDTISRSVRDADNIVCPEVAVGYTSDVLVVENGGSYTRYRIKVPAGTPDNVAVIKDTPVISAAEKTNINSFLNRVCQLNDNDESPVILTDSHPETGIMVIPGSTGTFRRDPKAGFKDVLTIEFEIGAAQLTPTAIKNQISPVPFKTTIELR